MPSTARRGLELVFNMSYLAAIWGLVIAMRRRRERVEPADQPAAERLREAFTLLAVGDTAHLTLRAISLTRGPGRGYVTWRGRRAGLIGLGEMATSITITLFYVLSLDAWRLRFQRSWDRFTGALLGLSVVRLLMLAMPFNRWDRDETPVGWGVDRNIPLLVVGASEIAVLRRDSRRTGDRTFGALANAMAASFACYLPVVLFARRIPQLGLLMIPKTLAYLYMALRVYRDLYRGRASGQAVPGPDASDGGGEVASHIDEGMVGVGSAE
ncbi:hypothetical protein OHB26_25575 [Nocardia sp. NBC_01503]|uniref:hypothetical protein n=1 Tax=Nocardia sp. NBC_01503 TaxID=2975997 RepID=UPI002E7AEFE5|nr:hypothetical protein [Nocardia sp. NBC_01503]WTL30299.1 hypothetical protein OHB26_25575 [Nocardia sp. NBC_01503]